MNAVTAEYLMGIKDARAQYKMHGLSIAHDELDNLNRTIKGFSASSPVGQMLRGERDFWKNQINKSLVD